jgi:iron complex transport system substrate-binding protein
MRFSGPLLAVALLVSGCSDQPDTSRAETDVAGKAVPIAHAKTFKVFERDGYRIVDIEASVVAFGGTAGGPPQRRRLVLVPREITPPPLTGDLAGASLVRIPVQRVAVNSQTHEAMLRALGVADRLVAVGGHNSYDDGIRARVKSGEIQQVGYGWHQPPTLDALVAAKPDIFLASIADLTHTKHLERVESLGIPVLPVFSDSEPHYLGRTDWVLLIGMLTGREKEAEAFVAEVNSEVAKWKALAAKQPQRSVLWAWYAGSRDNWSVTQRNGEAAMIRDANAKLLFSQPDNPELDSFSRLSTEQLLRDATGADCWMIRDPLSSQFTDKAVLQRFKAHRDGCVFWQPGRKNPATDGWELWEMGAIRPDWQLADIVKMVHPQLRDGKWRYLAPEDWKGGNGGAGHN